MTSRIIDLGIAPEAIDSETCRFAGHRRVVACIADPIVTRNILVHLKGMAAWVGSNQLPERRASQYKPVRLTEISFLRK